MFKTNIVITNVNINIEEYMESILSGYAEGKVSDCLKP